MHNPRKKALGAKDPRNDLKKIFAAPKNIAKAGGDGGSFIFKPLDFRLYGAARAAFIPTINERIKVMAVINTNITALIGQQNLTRSQSSLQTAMERLSSGLRINSAADDAAGQAIANRMSAQITGLSQAQRNANDGISVSQTAEGALNQINDNLQRIRQLTVQAQNGTNSVSDLDSIQAEIKQRLEEVDRVSAQTSFNGVKVLASNQDLSIQVGANDGEKINLNLQKIDSSTLGLSNFNVNGNQAATANDVLGKVASGGTVTFSSTSVWTATASGSYTTGSASTLQTITASEMASKVTGASSGTIAIKTSAAASAYNVDASTGAVKSGTGSTALTVYVDAANSNALTTSTSGAATLDPLATLDNALKQVDGLRSNLGAYQNRFESAITNLGTTTTNLTAARSRIEDADYATEVSNMTRAQILQQAGTSVLAQANQVPQTVLSLLR